MKDHNKRITLVVAMDESGGIGKNGKLPWNIPGELAYFKSVTSGPNKTVIMGRKTHDSIKRALPDRRNIVLSRTDTVPHTEGVMWANWPEQALDMATDDVYIIGGAEVYKLFMPMADRVLMSIIPGMYGCDTHFPHLPTTDWDSLTPREHEGFKTIEWVRADKTKKTITLQVNFAEIIDKANKRRMNLEGIVGLIQNSAASCLAELRSAASLIEMLDLRWSELDAEGRDLLPDEIQKILASFQSDFNLLSHVIGWNADATQGQQLGIMHLAQYAKPVVKPTPHLDEIVRVCEGPRPTYESGDAMVDIDLPEGVLRELTIRFVPETPNTANGPMWVCSNPAFSWTSAGPNPNDAVLEWEAQYNKK